MQKTLLKAEYLMAIMLQTGRLTDRERLARFLVEAEYDNELFHSIIQRFGLEKIYKKIMKNEMDKNYLLKVAETKSAYHKKKAQLPYEEKVKIIVELQKIKEAFANHKRTVNSSDIKKHWDILA